MCIHVRHGQFLLVALIQHIDPHATSTRVDDGGKVNQFKRGPWGRILGEDARFAEVLAADPVVQNFLTVCFVGSGPGLVGLEAADFGGAEGAVVGRSEGDW